MVLLNVWPTDASDGAVTSEARWRSMGRAWAPSAVINGVGGNLAPSLAGTNLTVQPGAAWIDGHYAELTGSQVLTVTANGLVVIRFDPAANTADLVYRDAATTPNQSPTGQWELPVAKIVASALQDVRAIGTQGGLTFATQFGLGLWANPPNGAIAVTLDNGWLWMRIAGAWVARYGAELTLNGYSLASGVVFAVNNFTVASSSGGAVANAGGITLPAAPGLVAASLRLESSVAPTSANRVAATLLTGGTFPQAQIGIGIQNTVGNAALLLPLDVANAAWSVQLFQNTGAAATINCRLDVWKVGGWA